MSSFPVHEMDKGDNIVRNTSVIGNACNQFFPTMMKAELIILKMMMVFQSTIIL